jgi:23S rRNA (cytosine1962-C5)-methyltransferase
MDRKKWINEGFDGYELIDAGGGEKLERFGDVVLIRPELQAYFTPVLSREKWLEYNPILFTEEKGRQGMWSRDIESWCCNFGELWFNLELTPYKHVGLFPEQSVNWQYLNETVQSGMRVLNLFAYTGAASIICASHGAEVVHVDSIKPMLSWARKNAETNGLDGISWVHEDAMKFVERELKRGRKYDIIIMDPPAWGIGAKGEKWKIEDRIESLIQTVAQLLNPNGRLIINTYSPKVQLEQLVKMSRSALPQAEIEAGDLWTKSTTGKMMFHGYLVRVTRTSPHK